MTTYAVCREVTTTEAVVVEVGAFDAMVGAFRKLFRAGGGGAPEWVADVHLIAVAHETLVGSRIALVATST